MQESGNIPLQSLSEPRHEPSSATEMETPALREYTVLKAEQILRITQRDHLLYANLGVVGAVCYFAFSEHGTIHSLLVIPWASFILGWTYFCNDEKVSSIRDYIAMVSSNRFPQSATSGNNVFGWEISHRSGKHRTRVKVMQLVVDMITFVLSGLAALFAYALSVKVWSWWQYVAVALASAIMLILTKEFVCQFLAETKALPSQASVD